MMNNNLFGNNSNSTALLMGTKIVARIQKQKSIVKIANKCVSKIIEILDLGCG